MSDENYDVVEDIEDTNAPLEPLEEGEETGPTLERPSHEDDEDLPFEPGDLEGDDEENE